MAEIDKSPIWVVKTRTFVGLALATAAILLPRYADFFNDPATDQLLQQIIGMVGIGIALYGRLHVQKTANLLPPATPLIPPDTGLKDEIGAVPEIKS